MSTERKDDSISLSEALTEAQSIIEAAEQRAREITRQAEQRFEESRNQGYREGYREGQKDLAEQAIRMIEANTELNERIAEQAAKLAIAIAGNIVSEHISTTPDTAKQIAIRAIRESVVGESLVIVFHPSDEAVFTKSLPELRRISGGVNISFESDSSLTRGGCIVRTEFGEIDASIESLLESVNQRLGLADR